MESQWVVDHSNDSLAEHGEAVKASMGLDSMTCTKSELVASALKE